MDPATSPSPPVAPLLPPLNSLALASPSSPPSSSLNAGPSSESTAPTIPPTVAEEDTERIEGKEEITYRAYQGEEDLDAIVNLVDDELSEPYNLYTYRYFLDEWCVSPNSLSTYPLPFLSESWHDRHRFPPFSSRRFSLASVLTVLAPAGHISASSYALSSSLDLLVFTSLPHRPLPVPSPSA